MRFAPRGALARTRTVRYATSMTDHRKRSRARRVEPAQLADSLDAFAARYFARRFPRPDRFAILDAIVRAVAGRFGPHVCVLSLFALALALTG